MSAVAEGCWPAERPASCLLSFNPTHIKNLENFLFPTFVASKNCSGAQVTQTMHDSGSKKVIRVVRKRPRCGGINVTVHACAPDPDLAELKQPN